MLVDRQKYRMLTGTTPPPRPFKRSERSHSSESPHDSDDSFFVASRFGTQVGGAVGQKRVARTYVDRLEQVLVHIGVVRARVVGSQTDALVEVNDAAPGECKPLVPMRPHEFGVNAL